MEEKIDLNVELNGVKDPLICGVIGGEKTKENREVLLAQSVAQEVEVREENIVDLNVDVSGSNCVGGEGDIVLSNLGGPVVQSVDQNVVNAVSKADILIPVVARGTPSAGSAVSGVNYSSKLAAKGKNVIKKSGDLNRNILIGVVNKEARNLIHAGGSSKGNPFESQTFFVKRNPPNSGLSISISCDGSPAILGDVSVGDSGIRFCNERFLAEHEMSLANKMWSFAKDNLGVFGKNNDEVYSGRLKSLEIRDKIAKGKKEKKNKSQ